jgi:adenosylcobinamide-GDP ribazoletransferase
MMLRSALADIRACLRLYSRLPVRAGDDGHDMPDLSAVGWAIPLAGGAIGGIGAIAAALSQAAHLPPLLTSAIAIGALALTTGAMHEDGLADTVDGFGGGAARDDKLAIMRDSRIGAYGALALCVSILIRAFALAAIVERSALAGATALVAVGAISRVAGLLPMATLPPARSDGAGVAAAQSGQFLLRAMFVATCVGFLPWPAGASLAQTVIAQLAAYCAALAIAQVARQHVGGYTGDVLGAAQQAAEIAALTALAAA